MHESSCQAYVSYIFSSIQRLDLHCVRKSHLVFLDCTRLFTLVLSFNTLMAPTAYGVVIGVAYHRWQCPSQSSVIPPQSDLSLEPQSPEPKYILRGRVSGLDVLKIMKAIYTVFLLILLNCRKLTGHVHLWWVSLPCCYILIGRRRVEGTENLHTFNSRPIYVRQRDHTVTKHPEGTDRMGFLKTSGSSCRK